MLRKNCLLKHIIEEKIKGTRDKEKYLSSYWMILRKQEGTENGESQH
jgi:hypothetical protein